jgi:hypothetical protein
MKKTTIAVILFGLIFATVAFSVCLFLFERSNISITVQDSEDTYKLFARYDKRQAKRVQHYLDTQLNTSHTFTNASVNANMTLNDHTSFYIKSYPGMLQIRFNKKDNDESAYLKIKQLEEGIKTALSTTD